VVGADTMHIDGVVGYDLAQGRTRRGCSGRDEYVVHDCTAITPYKELHRTYRAMHRW
jgi:hypothetical protein